MNSNQKSNTTNIESHASAVHQNANICQEINDLRLKQKELEEKLKNIEYDVIKKDEIDNYRKQIEKYQSVLTYKNKLECFPGENLEIFRIFIWNLCSDVCNWKLLAHSIYHIEHLINNLDNYQLKEILKKQFQILLNEFKLFMKELINLQIKSSTSSSEINLSDQIEQYIQNLKNNMMNLKELILRNTERFHTSQAGTDAIQTLLQAIDNINFDCKKFNKQDENQIRLLTLKQDLLEKVNKTDLIKIKSYIDNQIKELIELNKKNAKQLEEIKLSKTSTCEARYMQTILSNNSLLSSYKKQNRAYSYQSSRPYITLELDHIRKYQQQALLKSPYGTIPLYRRQAWAAANLFHDHPLHLLRHMQNSLRMQIHHLLNYDLSDLCNRNQKTKKTDKNSNIKIFNTSRDISIVGNDNKLYRGQIDSCEIIPLKNIKEKKLKLKANINENIEINFDQFDQINKTIGDEYLFEYLDWQTKFNEQDLPDELCEELFSHWKSILCKEQPCDCNSEIKFEENDLINVQSDSTLPDHTNDDQCISNDFEEYPIDESICLCSQYSCECLKDNQNEIQDSSSNILLNNQSDELTNETNIQQESKIISNDSIPIVAEEIILSDCFINQNDQWTRQFDLFQKTHPSLSEQNNKLSDSMNCTNLDLDDPTAFRQQILDRYQQYN
ncbi:unnamed protein product [Adineta steineri]|uniref:Uncharacterized protein n=2 Tax=Adineta steineri TaxID=433720 RepID=A0A814IG97_9BILA|nr:unnamed protein product [Adineta steineri]CAF3787919.1 unnamed protein product [Adineta steineri]